MFFDRYNDGNHYVVEIRRDRSGFDGSEITIVYIVLMTSENTGKMVFHSHVQGHPDMETLAKRSFDRYIEYVTMTPEEKAERQQKSDELKAKIKKRMQQHG